MAQQQSDSMMRQVQSSGQQSVPEGFERCFYTLWGKEADSVLWETQPIEDISDSILEGTGRQDWRKLRPFDMLPDMDAKSGGDAELLLYAGETLRVACQRTVGTQQHFLRAGDFQTIFFQFSGKSLVETSFGDYVLEPGEALLVPAMVAHRTTGSENCRRMVYYPREFIHPSMQPEDATTDIRHRMHAKGEANGAEELPKIVVPETGKVTERLTQWDALPGDDYIFMRTYDYVKGRGETGYRPHKVSPFNYYTTAPDDPTLKVRTSLLWENSTFRQRTYSNPGKQPGAHRGYDEDEFWFQFSGRVTQMTEHGQYYMEAGQTSMAEAGISHTSYNQPGGMRLTTYTNKPLRMVVDPTQHLRETNYAAEETIIKGWPGK